MSGQILLMRTIDTDRQFEVQDWKDIDPAALARAESSVNEIRPRLKQPFSDFSSHDLAVNVGAIVFRKPVGSPKRRPVHEI